MALRHALRRSLVASSARQAVRGAHGAPQPPFARNLAPTSRLDENHELVWDDGVAPETCLDFDAPHVPFAEGARWWLGGFAFFGGMLGLTYLSDAESKRLAVRRGETLPPTAFDPRTLFKGGGGAGAGADDDEEEEEEEEE